ncbi:FtsX-like permease family protein [archaeon]|nr:FtsX-like permease family protein [archaeon]
MKEVAERVEKKLKKSRDVNDKTQDFTILTPEELLESFGTVLNIITGFLIGVATISLIVGGIGIANTMYASVLERMKEIGIMKSVGARNKDILSIFIIESGILGAIGGILGVTLGFLISSAGGKIAAQAGFSFLKPSFPLWLTAGSILFAFIIGAVSGSLPAYRASKLKPVDALRYE